MVITCIVKGCDNKEKVYSAVMFHRIPTHHIQRRAWLAALNKNQKTPLMTLKKWRVCSEHFTPEDYTCTGTRLKDEATPTIFKSLTQQSGSSPNAAELNDIQQDLPEQEENFFVGVPHSTPQKHRAEEPTATFKVPLSVQLTSPLRSSKPAVALAPTWTMQSETHHIEATVMDMSATSVFDVSMTSEPAVDTADTSFVPNSSPSTTTTGSSSSISGQARGWKERKWIVNESKLLELFQKCTTCGAAMCDLNQTVTQFGSRININWQCSNGHMGQWESCPNIRGMVENNLFAAAATLFTGSTYTDIADWAGLFNLQLPLESTFYNIQASYLLPVIEKSYTQQENIIKARLICQSEDGEGVQLSGDGRSDSPGHSSKYNTYSFMDDSTNQIVRFEMMQVSQASSSVAMEPLAFKKGLEKILDEGIDVKVELLRRWMSLQHHITGVHRWEENGMEYRCFHQDLSAEEQRTKRWLKGNSPAFKALQAMIMDTRLIKDLQKMTLFKHTGQLEVFHNALLKYCPKRLHFQYPSMKARTMLAIMDHNENHSTKREQATTAAGGY
ncbi:THAP domain-containing protein 1 [Anabarilius grahami]|uniref:THAP domain-containing protein 1 n=1 Tax=Anabarilius grahami TaxID=495550 RepID=A0A3N0YSU9_ANAGA|nr:THAP domain-containing protein 1 [Anabarilius grahami]